MPTRRSRRACGLRQDQVRHWRDVGGKILALVGIEDREALEERNGFGLIAGFGGARALAVGNEAVGIDDGGAFFALAHMGPDGEPLKPRSATAHHRIRMLRPL